MKFGILKKLILIIFIITAIIVIPGLNNSVIVTTYNNSDERIITPFKVVLITDTHSCDYGDNQIELISKVRAENPDIILLGGDIVDDVLPMEKGYETIIELSKLAPAYYVSGNHEIMTKMVDEIKANLKNMDVKVLDGVVETIDIVGNKITIMGIDDPTIRSYQMQLEELKNNAQNENISFLLAHRPERLEDYESLNPDFIFSGHAHGGQWRLPIVLESGLLAPHQGFFPKLTNGVVDVGYGKLIVSRGLSRESTWIPRIYNSPEIVVVNFNK